ncbi:hypothetical protein Cgig2_012464 [Carnegiea gigantea]|uniref:Uncharacterized protein n=1 Tax=Carnegiea gigantea TaxID=171969 RepID=A0A9Q1QL41_9CARY|nr:hypothetical protein Cgig2_012464 [Carnegiea gigantea]
MERRNAGGPIPKEKLEGKRWGIIIPFPVAAENELLSVADFVIGKDILNSIWMAHGYNRVWDGGQSIEDNALTLALLTTTTPRVDPPHQGKGYWEELKSLIGGLYKYFYSVGVTMNSLSLRYAEKEEESLKIEQRKPESPQKAMLKLDLPQKPPSNCIKLLRIQPNFQNPNLLKPGSPLDWRLVWWLDPDRLGSPTSSSFSSGRSSPAADDMLWQLQKRFDPIRYNESWINYRRISGAIVVKCYGDRLYTLGLKYLLRTADYAIVTKEGMQEGYYDDELLKFLLQLEPENFQGSAAVRNKFAKLLKKEEEKRRKKKNKLCYERLRFCFEITRCKA